MLHALQAAVKLLRRFWFSMMSSRAASPPSSTASSVASWPFSAGCISLYARAFSAAFREVFGEGAAGHAQSACHATTAPQLGGVLTCLGVALDGADEVIFEPFALQILIANHKLRDKKQGTQL